MLQRASIFLFFSSLVFGDVPPNGSLITDPIREPDGPSWISNILASAMINYFPFGQNSSSLCTKQGHLVQLYSFNYTLWAVTMLDSYSKGPSGSVYGNLYDYGHYDQCLAAEAFDGGLKGQFVMVSLQLEPKEPIDLGDTGFRAIPDFIEMNQSYWSLVKYSKTTGDWRVRDRDKFFWSVCVPASCTDEDVEYSLNRTLEPLLKRHGIKAHLTVLHQFTKTAFSTSSNLLSPGPIIFAAVVSLLILVIVMSTVYHWMFINDTVKCEGTFDGCVQMMSLLYNFPKIFYTDENISAISGIKVISMFGIIYGHRMLISMFSPLHNSYYNEAGTGKFLNMYYFSGLLLVDTFLIVTGFLTFNKMLKMIDSKNQFNPFRLIYRRYIRFTPTYAFIIGLTIFIHPYLEGGPHPHTDIWDTSGCSTYWWTHLLYINNYLYTHHQCIIPSWYLAVDMQLYILCSVIGYVSWKYNKSVGTALLLIIALLSVVLPAIRLYITGYTGVTLLSLRNFSSYFKNDEFIETYMQTHFRTSPYIIGMLAALLRKKLEKMNIEHLKKKFKQTLFIITLVQFICVHVSMLGVWLFYAPGAEYTLVSSISYTILHRIGWAVPIAWFIVIHSSNLYAPFQKILGFPLFGPLNQIGYSVFLIHTLFQLYLASLNRAPIYYNWLTSWWMASGDIVLSYGCAIIVYLFVEAPFMNLLMK